MVLDIKKAFLHATMSRDVYIQLPPEEYVEGKYGVAKLRRALYGTRDAPLLWQAEVARVLSKLGFIQVWRTHVSFIILASSWHSQFM